VISQISPKQIEAILGSNRRINVWEGAVRSGKTYSSIIRFIKELKSGPPGAAMIVGVSRASLQRNILPEMCGILGIPVPTPKAESLNILNRTVHIVGASDERAQSKIQGSTLACAYVDETTLIPEGFFRMLLSRLSIPGARLFCTTNPDGPQHWFKHMIDDPSLDLVTFKFRIEDNPSLDSNFVESLKREYQGLWYDRYIEGKWTRAEGLVYSFFDDSNHVIDQPPGPVEYSIVACDYGTCNPTAFVLISFNGKLYPNIWVAKEYYWNSSKQGRQKTDSEYAEDMKEFIKGHNVRFVYVDPSAASLKLELQRSGIRGVTDANNDVLNGISYVSNLMVNGTMKIVACCRNLIEEFQSYRWDSSAANRGIDKPVKEFDHVCDALRYGCFTHFLPKLGSQITKADLDAVWDKVSGNDRDLPSFFRGGPQQHQGGRW
jgi:PBSX family phage terminase large subunit